MNYPYRLKSEHGLYFVSNSDTPTKDPREALHFRTEHDARNEAAALHRFGPWPLCRWSVVRVKGV
jgi:hypothetical protein